MIWVKTDAGLAEVKGGLLITRAATRNLLLLIDGTKSEELLLRFTVGVTSEDFRDLRGHGLIRPVGAVERPLTLSATLPAPAGKHPDLQHLEEFALVLGSVIATHLGLGGFVLAKSIQNAKTLEDMRGVARVALRRIQGRKGEAAAVEARQTLFGVKSDRPATANRL